MPRSPFAAKSSAAWCQRWRSIAASEGTRNPSGAGAASPTSSAVASRTTPRTGRRNDRWSSIRSGFPECSPPGDGDALVLLGEDEMAGRVEEGPVGRLPRQRRRRLPDPRGVDEEEVQVAHRPERRVRLAPEEEGRALQRAPRRRPRKREGGGPRGGARRSSVPAPRSAPLSRANRSARPSGRAVQRPGGAPGAGRAPGSPPRTRPS